MKLLINSTKVLEIPKRHTEKLCRRPGASIYADCRLFVLWLSDQFADCSFTGFNLDVNVYLCQKSDSRRQAKRKERTTIR